MIPQTAQKGDSGVRRLLGRTHVCLTTTREPNEENHPLGPSLLRGKLVRFRGNAGSR